ncbi:MAG: D-alanine--D-alanine ligase family protein [Pseudomonadales bacterium]
MSQPCIAVLMGGDSGEAEVSRTSAKGVIEALRENFADVHGIEADKNLMQSLQDAVPDLIFPILHGPPGEDGTLQGFLDILGYQYVGSGVQASAFAMDKIVAKAIFRSAGLPVIDDCIVQRGEDMIAAAATIEQTLGDYVVIKPASQGSALGITLIDKAGQLAEGMAAAFDYDDRLLVERRIDGREMTVGVLDTDTGSDAFPVIEITTPGDSWYDFEHRYTKGLSEHLMPADLPDEQTKSLQQIAVAAHQALGCRDMSRADFIVKDKDIYLLEVNTLPGMTPLSLYPDGARGYGLDFPALCKYLVERAASRS